MVSYKTLRSPKCHWAAWHAAGGHCHLLTSRSPARSCSKPCLRCPARSGCLHPCGQHETWDAALARRGGGKAAASTHTANNQLIADSDRKKRIIVFVNLNINFLLIGCLMARAERGGTSWLPERCAGGFGFFQPSRVQNRGPQFLETGTVCRLSPCCQRNPQAPLI